MAESTPAKKTTPAQTRRGDDVQEPLKMYDEDLVKEIMISTALCVQELIMDNSRARQDDVFEFVESNFRQIISETLRAEQERELAGDMENEPDESVFPDES